MSSWNCEEEIRALFFFLELDGNVICGDSVEHHGFQLWYVVELAIPRLVPSVLNLEVPLVQLLGVQLVTLLHPPETIKRAAYKPRQDLLFFETTLTLSEADLSHLAFLKPMLACCIRTDRLSVMLIWRLLKVIIIYYSLKSLVCKERLSFKKNGKSGGNSHFKGQP